MTSPLEQKKIRIAGPSVVTANRTWDGLVIYRTARGEWSATLSEAAIVRTSEEARALLAESVADDLGAVGACRVGQGVRDGPHPAAHETPQAAHAGRAAQQERSDQQSAGHQPADLSFQLAIHVVVV